MIAGPNVGFSRKPTKISAAITSAMTRTGTPHGLTVRPVDVRVLATQDHERDQLQTVREHGAPDRDVEHDRTGDGSGALCVDGGEHVEHDEGDEADRGADDERDPRGLALAGEREESRVVPGPGQRVHVAAVGEHDALQRGEQTDQGEQREHGRELVADDRAEAVEQRLGRQCPWPRRRSRRC